MAYTLKIQKMTIIFLLCLITAVSARINPELNDQGSKTTDYPILLEEESVVCSAGAVHNYITNSTYRRVTGQNVWTILIGDDATEYPSMLWTIPEEYASNNHYLYYSSLRIGYNGHQIHLSNETSPGLDILEPPESVSDFDTHFHISDDTAYAPPGYYIGVRVHQNTYAWSASDADDFIIYDYWIVNVSNWLLDSVYVALHADCDISVAEGGSGDQGWYIDDMVSYYRDDETGEYISYMYDGDNPAVPGNDMGGHLDPKESAGYIGSRLLYCPPIVGETTPSVQTGHTWWDWNSDPSNADGFADWYDLMSDGIWMDDPPSPFDWRFYQKTGPFEISPGDSIKVVFAYGIGNGLQGMRNNLNNARLLFENDYVYYDLPPNTPTSLYASKLDREIELSWEQNDDDDFQGYNIYSATDPDGPFQLVNESPIDSTNYLYTPSIRDYYYIYLTAIDMGGNESMPSETVIVSTLPCPPSNFRAISGDNLVRLSWDTVDDEAEYRLYRSIVSGGPYVQIAQCRNGENVYTDKGVINNQTYFYVVTSFVNIYESPYSGEIQVTPNPNSTDNGRVLLVDDYGERDDDGNLLEYQQRQRFYQRWGVYNFDYDIWSIADSGMVDSSVILNYQAVLFASDGVGGHTSGSWWYYVGAVGGGVLRYYLENGGHLLAVGQLVLMDMTQAYPPEPQPGDFEFDWLGIGSEYFAFDYWSDFTRAISAEPDYPDSMKIDIAKVPSQEDYAINIYSLRPGADTLFLWGLDVWGEPSPAYMEPVAIVYRPDGEAVTSLINFSLYFMPAEDAHLTINNILRDEFGCTFYEDPAPLPPWQVAAFSENDFIYLTWDAIDEDDVVAIKLYRSIFDGPFDLIASLAPDAGNYADEDIIPGTEYNYKLTCVDFAGQEGEFSQMVTEFGGRPQAPDSVYTETGDGWVTLHWSIPDDPSIVNFKIYRRVNISDEFNLVATVPPENSSYDDTDIANWNCYRYYLISVSEFDVESYPSDTVIAFPYPVGERSGLLIVNGVRWDSYGSQIINFYQNEVPSGHYSDYLFWDLFDTTPIGDLPHIADRLIGQGAPPAAIFDAFANIVWVGNNYSGDFVHWENNEANIMEYLNTGGNILLPVRLGSTWFFDELAEYASIVEDSWRTGLSPDSLVARHDSLTNIEAMTPQSLWEIPDTDGDDVIWLYEATNVAPGGHAGFVVLPNGPGGGGGFCYIAGRPYRWDNDDLKENCDVILRYFFGMPEIRVDIDDQESVLPKKFALHQNYPNPFNPNTVIRFDLPVQSQVSLTIYDILGRQVRVLADQQMDAGYHEVVWDGKIGRGGEASTGIYFYKLRADDFKTVKKMLMLK